MLSLYQYNVCCFLIGTFVLFTSGNVDSFDGMTLFIAMIDNPLLYFMFQEIRFPDFMMDDFTFRPVHSDRRHDLFHYLVSSKDFSMPVTVIGIDTSKPCGPLSNIDFVHFV